MWRAVSRADLVHSGVAGWPYPIGWIANSLALLRGRKLIIMVESAPWRVKGTPEETWKYRLRAAATEALGRWFVNHAHLAVFTQQSYLDTLMTHGRGRGVVTPSSWVNDEEIVGTEEHERAWRAKEASSSADVKLLFAGRFVFEKGIDVLLNAARLLDAEGLKFQLDVIGEGPLRGDCVAAAEALRNVRLSVLDPVPYGAPFFELVRRYHAVVVPTVNDVQTRILFDAYAQGVPVLATDTVGMRPYIVEGETGWLVPCGDVGALAQAIRKVVSDPMDLPRVGGNALAMASQFTHREMHRKRWDALLECFGPSRGHTAAGKAGSKT
jgi:glycosyltransferase involved in cell wall biosynthesis